MAYFRKATRNPRNKQTDRYKLFYLLCTLFSKEAWMKSKRHELWKYFSFYEPQSCQYLLLGLGASTNHVINSLGGGGGQLCQKCACSGVYFKNKWISLNITFIFETSQSCPSFPRLKKKFTLFKEFFLFLLFLIFAPFSAWLRTELIDTHTKIELYLGKSSFFLVESLLLCF